MAFPSRQEDLVEVRGVCPHDCPDTCAWIVTVDRTTGRAIRLRGAEDHPITRGFLCTKVNHYLERTYHPERLLHPLRRTGAKGKGRFERITWDEALDEIAQRLKEIIERYGAEAILPYSYTGTMGVVQGQSMDRRFFHRLGATRLLRTICSDAGFTGLIYTLGAARGTPPEAFAHARYIILWGANLLTTNVHLWPFVREAQKNGAKVVCIDPVRTRTARASDWWLPILPGTDGALALAMMHVIFREGLEDREFIEEHCFGGDQLRERVMEWSPERAAAITGLAPDAITRLAREYATTRPAVIRINYGLQRHAGGGMAVRNIACLPALVGAWRDVGGGLLLSTSGAFPLNDQKLERPDLRPRDTRAVNMVELGRILNEMDDPPIKALVVYNSNPAAVAPDQAAVHKGLSREDLFTVVLEHFQTDTADYADIVLPATTQLEHWDLVKPYGHYYLALNHPAIAPLGESKPNSEIFRLLAQRMGFDDPCFQDDDLTIIRQALESDAPELAGVTLERLQEHGFVRLNLPELYRPFANGHFPTPSGKCELYSERMAQDGYDPLPTYTPPNWEKSSYPKGGDGELLLVSPSAHYFLNSSFANVERLLRREGEPVLWIHPDDAARRDVKDGQMVRVWNERGDFLARARVTEDVRPGVCMTPSVWWSKLSPGRRNVNFVTSQALADMGGGATFHDCVVNVGPAD
ncbi:MAG: molybdopterin oxidoreductase family protein [Anaerolineae bacterium]|nr:molybdopterin oxidoreductase family protein [Anaerolineae bacterium]